MFSRESPKPYVLREEEILPRPERKGGASFSVQAFHWHGETFDLPPGATRIAKSDGCENQAFQLGQSVIGLQFHLETTPQAARDLVEHCRDEMILAPCIQTRKEILSANPAHYQSINDLLDKILTFLMRTA